MGYVKIRREVFASRFFNEEKVFCKRAAWIDLILLAAWKTHDVKGVTVKRGQVYTTYRFLGKRWGWSLGKVQRFLRDTQNDTKTEHQTVQDDPQNGTLITIVNYDKYQGDIETEEVSTEQAELKTERETIHKRNAKRYDQKKSTKEEVKKSTNKVINGWAIWIDVNRERGRSDPMPEGADTRAAKTLKDRYKTEAALKGIYREFLDDQDKWLVTNCHALRFLPARVVKYENPAPKQTYVPEYDKVYPTEADAARYAEEAKRMSADEVQQYLLNLGITDGDAARRAFDYDRRTPSSQKTA